jgi:hypothetical protein
VIPAKNASKPIGDVGGVGVVIVLLVIMDRFSEFPYSKK